MAAIHINLLGEFDVRLSPDSPPKFRLQKSKVLLAYLGLQNGAPTSREKLAHLLWSDRNDKQARASLRQALSELRKVLGHVQPMPLVTNNFDVTLDPSAFELDACRFVCLSNLPDEASLQAAVDLYKGAFFEGVDAGCPAFEDWIDQERRGYHDRAVRTLAKVLARNVAANRPEQAIFNAEQLLVLDPLNEETCRILMRLYAAEGQSTKALQLYDQFQVSLRQDLNVSPEPETDVLADQICGARLLQSSAQRGSLTASVNERAPKTPDDVVNASDGRLTTRTDSFRRVIGDRRAGIALGALLAVTFSTLGYLWAAPRGIPIAGAYSDTVNSKGTPKETAALESGQPNAEIAVRGLSVETEKPTAPEKHKSSNARAVEAFLQGMELFRKQTPIDLSNAISRFERALALDPEFSRAQAALANTYLYAHVMHWPAIAGLGWPRDALDKAETLAGNALLKENPPALAFTVLAKARFFGFYQPAKYDEAVVKARQAFLLDPNDAAPYLGLGQIFIYGGEPERAIAHLELARKLDPRHTGTADYLLALAYFHLEEFATAADHVEQALEESSDAYSVWALGAAIYSFLDRKEDAILAINHARSLSHQQGVGAISASLTPGYMSYVRSMDRARLRSGLDVACVLIGVKLGE